MTEDEARAATIELFGKDSFTETDDGPEGMRFYVGKCPTTPGAYYGFMGFSWERAPGTR